MKNLKVWQKLGLMGVVFLIPLALLTWRTVVLIDEFRIEVSRLEARGLEYYAPLRTLLRDLQQHRGMASAWLSGDASFKEKLAVKRSEIERDLRSIDAMNQQQSVLQIGERWRPLS